MVVKKHGVIIETQRKPGKLNPVPSVLLLLITSVSRAVLILAIVWFVFFRT